jgi:hypothetical protein
MKIKPIILKAIGVFVGLIVFVAVGIYFLHATSLSYFYCSFRENSWKQAVNEEDLESRLFAFYSKFQIEPANSYMGRDHVLKPGQIMTRYMIFNKEPLDVVYNADMTMDAFYPSYE